MEPLRDLSIRTSLFSATAIEIAPFSRPEVWNLSARFTKYSVACSKLYTVGVPKVVPQGFL